MHFAAGTRLLLGSKAKPVSLVAYTALLYKHLPPVDTVNSVWKTESGISGTFSVSFGTTFSGHEYAVACERGSVIVFPGKKVIVREGLEEDNKVQEKDFKEEGNGVKQEIQAFAESIIKGKADPKQYPEEALADLELIEKMLKSGEEDGRAAKLEYQV